MSAAEHRHSFAPFASRDFRLLWAGTALAFLAFLIAMVTQVVGDNVARAFSLVGALSIVRFRTVVRDTRDTAFVIFAVAVGMAMGAQAVPVALIGLAVMGLTAFVLAWTTRARAVEGEETFLLTIRTALGLELEQAAGTLLDRHLAARQMQEIRTAKTGALLDYTMLVRPKPDGALEELVKSLHRVEGIQDVRLRRRGEDRDE